MFDVIMLYRNRVQIAEKHCRKTAVNKKVRVGVVPLDRMAFG